MSRGTLACALHLHWSIWCRLVLWLVQRMIHLVAGQVDPD